MTITVFGKPLPQDIIDAATSRMQQGNFKVADVSLAIYQKMEDRDHKASYRMAVAIKNRLLTVGSVKRVGMTKYWRWRQA